MNKLYKPLSLIVMLILVTGMLASCAVPTAEPQPTAVPAQQQDQQKPAETSAPQPAAGTWQFPTEKVTIEILWHEYAPFTAYVKELIDAYQKLHPNVTINANVTSSNDLPQKLSAALATGTGPDIMDQDASYYVLYYDKGVLEPVNLDVFGMESYDDLIANYTPGGLDAGTFDGKVYALPYQGNSMSLFINNKLFRDAGLDPAKDAPKTWDDMMKICPKLKIVEGDHTVQKAFDFPYHSARWQLQDFQPMTEQFGGKILSDDGKTVYLNSPEAVKAMELWKQVTDTCGDPKTTMNTSSNPNQDFIDGRLAMWITGPWATPQIKAGNVDFSVVSLPQVDPANKHTLVYGWMWGVNKDKPDVQKQVAWDFVHFMLSKPDEWLAKAGFLQPVKALMDTETAKNFPFIDVHMDDIQTGSWYVRSPNTNEISLAVGAAVERVVYDNADPKASLDTAQAEAEKAMGK